MQEKSINSTNSYPLFPSFTYTESKAFEDLFRNTCIFNTCANSDVQFSNADLVNQFKYIAEEIEELDQGICNEDVIEQLDGAVDSIVTLVGYMQKIRNRYGIDLAKAFDLIAQNNLDKFPKDIATAEATVKMYEAKGIETYIQKNEQYDCYVIRDKKTDKVKKPIGFIPVNLADCFPKVN